MNIKKSYFKIIFLLLLFISNTTYSQDNSEDYSQVTNPIIFGDLLVGMSGGGGNLGFLSGAAVSYQYKANLFSLRYIDQAQLGREVAMTSPTTAFPSFYVAKTHKEYAVMYGLREIFNRHSISFSAGISYNNLISHLRDEEYNRYTVEDNFIGLPFEFTIRWFKKDKRRFHIYYVIPVGKPTAFGGSFGFKLLGNVSKNTFLGVGIVYGFGMFKNY